MSIIFPPNPAAQTPTNVFSPTSTPLASDNFTTYTYDGEKWVASPGVDGGGGGTSYWERSGDTLNPINDGDNIAGVGSAVFAGDIQSTSQNSGQLAGFRNQLINGDFRVWQRGTSFIKNSDTFRYTADRWAINGTAADASLAAGLPGFANGIFINNVTSGVAYIVQHIETGLATNDFCQFVPGSTWTLSYWMRDNTSGTPSVDFRGNSGGANQLSWTATGPVEEIETQGSWKRYSRTFIAETYVQGQHDRATVYIPSSSSANTLFTGIQLEPGSLATPFEHRPIGTELALCQRYYQKSYNQGVAPGTVTDKGMAQLWGSSDEPGNIVVSTVFATPMRVAPSLASWSQAGLSGVWLVESSAGGLLNQPTTPYRVGDRSFGIYVSAETSWAVCYAEGHWTANAEL